MCLALPVQICAFSTDFLRKEKKSDLQVRYSMCKVKVAHVKRQMRTAEENYLKPMAGQYQTKCYFNSEGSEADFSLITFRL